MMKKQEYFSFNGRHPITNFPNYDYVITNQKQKQKLESNRRKREEYKAKKELGVSQLPGVDNSQVKPSNPQFVKETI